MIIYEQERSNKSHYIYHQNDTNLTFPVHMHHSFEFITVLEGELDINIEQKSYTMKANDCAIILPNKPHSYSTKEFSKSYLCVFSIDYANEFYKKIENLEATNSVFHLDNASDIVNELENPLNIFDLKSTIYHLLALFYNSTTFSKSVESKTSFVHDVLNYVEQHYAEDLTLNEIAKNLGYTYNYTSTLFNQIFKTNFPDFLNECRVSYACQMIIYSNKSISEIASLCGYNSLRAFNRNFLKIKKTTPSDFRKNYSDSLIINNGH